MSFPQPDRCGHRSRQSDEILLVDDDPGTIQLLQHILGDSANLRFATRGADALRLARESVPDLVLLDAEMPGMSGSELCAAMKAEPSLADVPVIIVTSHSEAAREVASLEMGAVDFIAKPLKASLVLARVRAQLRAKHRSDDLRGAAANDTLTGLANRRSFDDALDREWRRGRRSGDPISLLMIEVDHFAQYNELYGPAHGNRCLRSIGDALVRVASRRGPDLVARHGAETFAVLLPQTARGGAKRVAHFVLDTVDALALTHTRSPTAPYVTVSVGISSYDGQSQCWVRRSAVARIVDEPRSRVSSCDLVTAADRALESAQHAGRAQARFLDIADVEEPQRTGIASVRHLEPRLHVVE
jgi:diguanylate cyclase (GGDEF)-like protein